MNKSNSFIGWAGLVIATLVIIAAGLFVLHHDGHESTQFGGNSGGPTFNAGANFPVGLTLGTGNRYLNRGVISLAKGRNQIAWKNVSGRTVYVNLGDAEMAGTASTTFKLWVGTSTTATVADTFNYSAPFYAQFINGATVATATPAGVVADNIGNHASGTPGAIAVAANQYLLMVASACAGGSTCESATSTNRGWTTMTLPFLYTY